MSDQLDRWDVQLREQYPKMFNGQNSGLWVGPGWQKIVHVLCTSIQHYIDSVEVRRKFVLENGKGVLPEPVPQVVVMQIKEKFGTLRFYYDGGDQYILGLVSMAEEWADRTCEECGEVGSRRSGGWIKTLCDKHEAERVAAREARFAGL